MSSSATTATSDATDRRARAAAIVFGVYLVAAWFLLLFVKADYFWFLGDEWDFLADRGLRNLDDLFRSHGEHWATVPVIVYRLLYQVFGLNSYLPYQALVVTSHLVLALVLRAVMRRCGVGPWIATGVAALFVLFGPGEDSIVWGFEVGFSWAIIFGVAHLWLSDHDGGIDRRDWLGLLFGLLALMCYGGGLVMMAVVGIFCVPRRSWRIAAFHTVPLAASYLAWYVVTQPVGVESPRGRGGTVGEITEFAVTAIPGSIRAVGGNLIVGTVIFAMAGVGLVLLVRSGRWRQALPAGALLIGAGGFVAGTALTRSWLDDFGNQSRLIYPAVALLLPAIAVGLTQFATLMPERWAPLVLLPLLPALWLNYADLDTHGVFYEPTYHEAQRDLITVLAHSDAARETAGYANVLPWLTAGWLVRQADAGEIPQPTAEAIEAVGDPRAYLVAGQHIADVPADCSPWPNERFNPEKGSTFFFEFEGDPGEDANLFTTNIVSVAVYDEDGKLLGRHPFVRMQGQRLKWARDDLFVEVTPMDPNQTLLRCT